VAPTKQNLLAEMEPTDNRRNRIANALSRLGEAASRRPWDIAGYSVILLLGKCSLLHFIVFGGSQDACECGLKKYHHRVTVLCK
jgi:hypothetical protein